MLVGTGCYLPARPPSQGTSRTECPLPGRGPHGSCSVKQNSMWSLPSAKSQWGVSRSPRTPGKQLRCPCPNVIPLALNDAPRQWTRFLTGTAIRGSRLRWEWLAPHLTWGHGCASDGGCSSKFPCGGLSRTRSTPGVQAARAPQASLFCLCQRLLKGRLLLSPRCPQSPCPLRVPLGGDQQA